jgi:hypothetical protein
MVVRLLARLSGALIKVGLSLLLACLGQPAFAHEVRPALPEIIEYPNHRYDILWKQPTVGDMAVHLAPQISGGLLDRPPTDVAGFSSFQILRWRNLDGGKQGLEGRTLRIDGIEQTITDVLVSIRLANGNTSQQILRPQAPSMMLRMTGTGRAVSADLTLGIEHILTGIDHLAFVLGLILLVRSRMTLIKTVTAFTVSHSMTLAATALHLIAPRTSLIEALVAFSILFVAVELLHHYRGRDGLMVRYPWLIAFTFGLLHGCAFASALTEIGLPQHAIPLSLMLFNVGVEIGQLLFITLVLVVAWTLAHLPRCIPAGLRSAFPYILGSFAAFWFFERITTAFGS